jgi:hypothetical protein
MTSAELTAYFMGRDLGIELAETGDTHPDSVMPVSQPLTEDQQTALERLGEAMFGYWVARGAGDGFRGRLSVEQVSQDGC